MVALNEQSELPEQADPFLVEGPTPLPEVLLGQDLANPIAGAERDVAAAEGADQSTESRVASRLALADAWLTVGAVAPALESVRQAAALAPDDARVLERLGHLLERSGAHREAGDAYAALARASDQVGAWLSAGRAFARAGAADDLDAAVEEMLVRFPADLAVTRFAVEAARAAPGSTSLVPRLLAASRLAIERGDSTYGLACGLDAWVESHGLAVADLVAGTALARGEGEASYAVAVDAAARSIAAESFADAGILLALAARAARVAGSLPREIVAQCAATMFAPDPAAREAVRELLSEAGRTADLAARLRSEARRAADPEHACAAWKGVAAVEAAEMPARAVFALAEALVWDPADGEARDMLRQLAAAEEAREAVRDALFWATRAELPASPARRGLLVLLGELEARAGDPAAALLAYTRALRAGDQSVLDRIEAVTPEAEALFAVAEATLREVETASRDDRPTIVASLLKRIGSAPGAIRDLGYATRVLAPLAGHDERVAALWVAATRRLGDSAALLAALRRIATRSTGRAERARAALELAEILDQAPDTRGEALEVLQQLLDEQPGATDAAAALAACAEHAGEPTAARAALAALLRAETDPDARGALGRLLGEVPAPASSLGLVARALDETPSLNLRDRATALRDVMTLLGESPALLARRTRAMLARPGDPAEGLDVARRFAEAIPLSPEATIAWFGAAGIAGDAEQLAEAAVAVVHSLAAARDAASVARAAVTRLFALDQGARGARVAREATLGLGLSDRGLRSTMLEYAQQQPDAGLAVELLEAAIAGAPDAPAEQVSALRRLAQLHRTREDAVGEAYALRRLVVHAPAEPETLRRLVALLFRIGDARALSRALALKLAAESDPAERRDTYLTLAALQLSAGERPAATLTLDRYAEEQDAPSAYAETARALIAAGAHATAVDRLSRWAERSGDPRTAAAMYFAAARVLRTHDGDPARAVALLRQGLAREPESPELLLLAEEIATGERAVRPMLEIYRDLDEAAAGQHGRRALAYRRASFLEGVGESEPALAEYLALFEQAPASGALMSAIERLAALTGKPDVLVGMFTRLAETAHNGDARVKFYLLASRVAREQVHDRRAALDLALLAHDVKRDEATAEQAIEVARSLKSLDPAAFRGAVETVIDRTVSVADEVWEDSLKRSMSLRAAAVAASEIADVGRTVHAVEVFFKGAEDKDAGRVEVLAMLESANAPAAVREAVNRLPAMRAPEKPATEAPAPGAPRDARATDAVYEQVLVAARAGDRDGALARAREALARNDHPGMRALAEELARETENAAAELELLEHRLDRTLDNEQRLPLLLRVADLLRGPLNRPLDARARLEVALQGDPDNVDLVRGLHDVAEQLGAWEAVAELLSRRIARAQDRAEMRALRLHRAAVLEQRLDNMAAARRELESILEDEPGHRPALRYLADLFMREGEFQDAGECFARAAASTPIRVEAAELLGMAGDAFQRGGDDVAADAQYRRALELDARASQALRGLSEIARRRNDWAGLERLLTALAAAQDNERDRVPLRIGAARAALEAGALYRAKGHLDAVRRHAPPDEVAQLDAVLQHAWENDRPISRPAMRAVRPGEQAIEPTPAPAAEPATPVAPPPVPATASREPAKSSAPKPTATSIESALAAVTPSEPEFEEAPEPEPVVDAAPAVPSSESSRDAGAERAEILEAEALETAALEAEERMADDGDAPEIEEDPEGADVEIELPEEETRRPAAKSRRKGGGQGNNPWLAAERAIPRPIAPLKNIESVTDTFPRRSSVSIMAPLPKEPAPASVEVSAPARASTVPPPLPPVSPVSPPVSTSVEPAATALVPEPDASASGPRRNSTPRPMVRTSPPGVLPSLPIELSEYENLSDEALRIAGARGDDDALRALSARLARSETGRPEAILIERQRFVTDPTRTDTLEALVGLYGVLGRLEEARAVRTVLDVFAGREGNASPPPLQSLPEPASDAAMRLTLSNEFALVGEIGAMLWDALGNQYRREVASYGVTGIDRVLPGGPTELSKLYASASRLLGLSRTMLFVRPEVSGGAIAARTQPPAVILAAPLANDTPVGRYVLGSALESTRPPTVLASTLEPEERATLVRAVLAGFGASGVMAGAAPAEARVARELFSALAPRAQRRLQELLAELESLGVPFSEETWMRAAEIARARAGLLVSGDFGVAARMVVSRYTGGGEPDVRAALHTLEPLRDLARFAISETYLSLRWNPGGSGRSRW